MQRTATARTGRGVEVEPNFLSLQMIGEARTIRADPVDRLLRASSREKLLRAGDIGVKVFEAQLQLITIETLGTPAELAALQLLYDQPQALDLGLGLGEFGPFTRVLRRQLADQPVQCTNIIR
jgi:hypothetical protein